MFSLPEFIAEKGIHGKVVVSAEIGMNHNGDPALAMKCIELAAECGAQAVKFQNYRTGDFVKSRTSDILLDGKRWNEWDLFSRCELDFDTLRELKAWADQCGLLFHSTPTSESGMRDLRALGCEVVKLASDMVVIPEMREAAEAFPGVIASDGCRPTEGTICSLGALWLHCVREYPAQDADLKGILRLYRLGKLWVGYSSHVEGVDAEVAAVRDYDACWLEMHLTPDHSLPGPDHRWSKDPCELKQIVKSLSRL